MLRPKFARAPPVSGGVSELMHPLIAPTNIAAQMICRFMNRSPWACPERHLPIESARG
jgi:hypothetical protein